MENLDEDYFDDFRNAIVEYGIEKINEILSEDSIVALFGKCKAENGSLMQLNIPIITEDDFLNMIGE